MMLAFYAVKYQVCDTKYFSYCFKNWELLLEKLEQLQY